MKYNGAIVVGIHKIAYSIIEALTPNIEIERRCISS
jgi:hypothetical protein